MTLNGVLVAIGEEKGVWSRLGVRYFGARWKQFTDPRNLSNPMRGIVRIGVCSTLDSSDT